MPPAWEASRWDHSIFGAFVLSGALAGLAGVLWATQYNTIDATAATGLELQIIAAVVVGDIAILGGSGSVIGAALGALLLQTINSALNVLGVPSLWGEAISVASCSWSRSHSTVASNSSSRPHCAEGGFASAPETHALKERLAPFVRWETGLAIESVAVAIFGNSVS